MPTIFINYRRADTKSEARLLYIRLCERFSHENVIMDIDSIPPAADFRDYIAKAVARCDIFIALIGVEWLEAGDLHNPQDWVRIEIEAAVTLGRPIIPIEVNDGRIPKPAQLPPSLSQFALRNGIHLDTGIDFDSHIQRIGSWIERLHAEEQAKRQAEEKGRREQLRQPYKLPAKGFSHYHNVIQDEPLKDTWLHREGQRDSRMVSFDRIATFGSCRLFQPPEEYQMSLWRYSIVWKVSVRPVAGANLDEKRVGIVIVKSGYDETLLGNFFSSSNSCWEEWRVEHGWEEQGYASQREIVLLFRVIAWYQDGLGHTYYDDNNGEGHMAQAWRDGT